MTFSWPVFIAGTIGGLLAELLKLYNLKTKDKLPKYMRRPLYWIITILMALVGGGLAVIYNIGSDSLVLALNIGISAPLILKGMADSTPTQAAPMQSTAGEAGGTLSLEDGTPKPRIIDMIAGR